MNLNLSTDTLKRSSAYASIGVSVVLIALKGIVYFETGSLSVQVSLLDSILDAIASFINVYAIHKSLQPPTHEYRFGFGKAEALAGLGQSALIFASALWLGVKAITHITSPMGHDIDHQSLYLMVMASGLTILLIMWQRYVMKRTESLAVAADNLHYETDLYLNVGTFFALYLTHKTGYTWIDVLFALSAVALIAYRTIPIAQKSFDVLMDRELDLATRQKIIDITLANPDVKGIHELRTRSSGNFEVIQFHIVLDNNMTLHHAHSIAHAVEDAVIAEFPNAHVIIHQDPYQDEVDTH
ncbi:MAG: cation diffusion facilitator family transporter [Alphaproteobacteria bacterium]|nr:cation diffusion facilitator family transporter [Alphaproteobacteria bacterium]